jgi:hypothetical protein
MLFLLTSYLHISRRAYMIRETARESGREEGERETKIEEKEKREENMIW